MILASNKTLNPYSEGLRELILRPDNLRSLQDKPGLTIYDKYRPTRAYHNTQERRDLLSFFKYMDMVLGDVCLINNDGVNSAKYRDENNVEKPLRTFGGSSFLKRITRKQTGNSYRIKNINNFKSLLRLLGFNIIDDQKDSEIKAYRWGILNSQNELEKYGIFFINGVFHLVDLQGEKVWGGAKIKKVKGNKVTKVDLRSYPNGNFIKKKVNGKTLLQSRDDLIAMLEALDFKVASRESTERLLKSQTKTKLNRFINSKVNKTTGSRKRSGYFQRLALNLAIAHLKRKGATNISVVNSNSSSVKAHTSKKEQSYLRYKDPQTRRYVLAIINHHLPATIAKRSNRDDITEAQEADHEVLKDKLKKSGVKYILNVRDINPKQRTGRVTTVAV